VTAAKARRDEKLRADVAAAVVSLSRRSAELASSDDPFNRGIGTGIDIALDALFAFTNGEVGVKSGE
jgi:hypothetical protein